MPAYLVGFLLVFFLRSPIHGRGLFCKRNIDAGEMVIEYSGNVIRSILTDKREKYYDSKVSCGLVQKFLKSLGELDSGCEGRTGLGRAKAAFGTSFRTLGLQAAGDISILAGALEALLTFPGGLGRAWVQF